jgi:hypothetical protein
VDVAQKLAQRHGVGQVLDVPESQAGNGPVVEHEEHAAEHQDQEEKKRDAAQAPGIGPLQRPLADLRGLDVHPHVADHVVGAVPRRVAPSAAAKNAAPDLRVDDFFFQFFDIWHSQA